MLKPRQRLTKRQIKEDKFVTFTANAATFIRDNLNRIILGGILAVVLAVIIAVSVNKQRRSEEDSESTLAKARIAMPAGGPDEAIGLYMTVIEGFEGTPSAAEATVDLGNLYFDRGEYKQAIKYFQTYLDEDGDDDTMVYNCASGIAASMEQQGKYHEAAVQYKSFADKSKDSAFAPRALIDSARCFVLVDMKDEAQISLKRIVDSYPDSELSSQAKHELNML